MSEIMTKEQVLEKIGAKDFRSVKTEQIMAFVSSIPDMDKEVALECIKQFPYFKECAEGITSKYNDLCSEFLHDTELPKIQIAGHQKVIDAYSERITTLGAEMSHEEYIEMMELMSNEADKISRAVERHLERKLNVLKFAGAVASLSVTVASTVIGVKTGKLPFPKA